MGWRALSLDSTVSEKTVWVFEGWGGVVGEKGGCLCVGGRRFFRAKGYLLGRRYCHADGFGFTETDNTSFLAHRTTRRCSAPG